MVNQRKYKNILWEWMKKSREIVTLHSYKPIIGSALSVLWIASKNGTIDINKTINIIEQEDPKLSDIIYTLLDSKIQNKEERIQLIEDMAKDLNSIDAFTTNEIRNIVNYLIMEMDFGGGKKDSITITPEPIKDIMVGLIEPVENMRVADYFSGTGSILLKINEAYRDYNLELYGEEIDNEAYLLSELLLIINEVKNYDIANKDVYDLKNAKKNSFDYVLMDSSFSLRSSKELEENEVFSYGIPNRTRIDWGGYQVGLHALKDIGRSIVTAPTGALFRSSDSSIRKAIIDDDKIEAIIQLPERLYKNTGISTSIIIFNKTKTKIKQNKIIFIDASNEYIKEKISQNTMTKESIEKIINCINENKEIEGFSIVKEINKVCENHYNLNSNVYINNRIIKEKLGKTKILSEVADVITGVQLSKKDLENLKRDPTHYYLNVRSIGNNEIIYDEEDKIRDKKIDWYGKYDIKAGDILITSRGTSIRMVVVPDDFKDSFISNNLSIIRVKQNKYDPYVLLKYLESEIGKLVLQNVATGSSIMVMNAGQLSGIEIPDYDMDVLESVGKRIKKNESEYKLKLNELKKQFENENRKIIKELKIN